MNGSLFSDVFLPITLAVITLGLGLSISFQDIRNIVYRPKNIGVGLFSQLLLLPIISFSIALITGLDRSLAVGLVLISVCPGGATSNLVNFMVRGNVALSLSITVVNGLITIFTIPLITQLALDVFMKQETRITLAFLDSVFEIFRLTVLPATVGILIRHYRPHWAARTEEPLRYILPSLLFLVYAGVLFLDNGNDQINLSQFFRILPYAFSLNILALITGYFVPGAFRLSKTNRFTIAVEVGLQNSTLAIFVASTLLNNQLMAMVAVVYGSFSFFTTWAFGYLARKRF